MAKLNTALTEFGNGARALAELLKESPPLTAVDQLFIENHLHIVQLTYSAWKRRHGLSNQGGSLDRDVPVA